MPIIYKETEFCGKTLFIQSRRSSDQLPVVSEQLRGSGRLPVGGINRVDSEDDRDPFRFPTAHRYGEIVPTGIVAWKRAINYS